MDTEKITTSDHELTDLFAAHRYMSVVERPYGQGKASHRCAGCAWEGEQWADHPAHLAAVVGQHLQTQVVRLAELDAAGSLLQQQRDAERERADVAEAAVSRGRALAAQLKREGREVLGLRVAAALDERQR